MEIEDIFPKEYVLSKKESEELSKKPVYVFDDENKKVITHNGWEYYEYNWNRHRVPRHNGSKWFIFSSLEYAEKFVTKNLKRNIEDFSFQFID